MRDRFGDIAGKVISIEIKARCSDPDRIRHVLESKNAEYKGTDHQLDTYFKVNSGRLKLREGNIENHLIFYMRENKKGPKQSDVSLFKTEPNSALKSILTEALGILVVVDKRREIFFIDNVKFHIDSVKNLGRFMEIEAIGKAEDADIVRLQEECTYYLNLFKISSDDLVADSYSDLLKTT